MMDKTRQNYNNHNSNGSSRPSVASKPATTKPAIPSKPAHLKSIKKKEGSKVSEEKTNTRGNLTRIPSVDHTTPRSWVSKPTLSLPKKEQPGGAEKNPDGPVPKSPFAKPWRPAPQLKLNKDRIPKPINDTFTIVEEKVGSVSKAKTGSPKNDYGCAIKNNQVTVEPKVKVGLEEKANKPSTLQVNNQPQGRTGIQHRSSFLRDPKSPGFGTIRAMWNTKVKTPSNNLPSPILTSPKPFEVTKRPVTKTRSVAVTTGNPLMWQHVQGPRPQAPHNSGIQMGETKRRTSSLSYQAPLPFRSASISEETEPTVSNELIEENESKQSEDIFKFEDREKSLPELENCQKSFLYSNSTAKPKIPTPEPEETNEKQPAPTFSDPPVGIYQSYSSDDSEASLPPVDKSSDSSVMEANLTAVGVYEDFDENDETVTAAVYSFAQQVDNLPSDPIPAYGYLPMSGASSTTEINYEQMDSDVKLESIDYTSQVVPPPVIKKKSTREYHEIDPNGNISVPPPPTREAPKLPTQYNQPQQLEYEPPPLPPDNPVGRRSVVFSKQKKLMVVQQLKENTSMKKLNYIDVEVTSNSSGGPRSNPVHRKTNYSDVIVLSESDARNSEKNESGDENLSSNKKSKDRKKKSSFLPFSSKDNTSSSPKSAKEEVLTDFEKERNKIKRISGRFRRKKDKDKKKKDRNSDGSISQSFESDSGYDIDSSSTTVSSETSQSYTINTSSGSAQSSGDGEVRALQCGVPYAYGDSGDTKKWHKVLPTTKDSVERRRSSDATSPFKRNERIYKKSLSHGNIESTMSVYPPETDGCTPDRNSGNYEGSPNKDPPKVSSFLHCGPPNINPPDRPPPKPTNPSPRHGDPMNPTPRHRMSFPLPGLAPSVPRPVSPGLPTSPPPFPPEKSPSRDSRPKPLSRVIPPSPQLHPPTTDRIYSTPEGESDGETPPPLPERDAIYEGVDVLNVVPPSPCGILNRSKLLDSEPLYQIYRSRTLSHASTKRSAAARARNQTVPETGTQWKSELMSEDLGTSTLWREIPEVADSGHPKDMSKDQIKLQQSQFEVITSQASYLRSLNILVHHFMEDWAMESTDVLPSTDRKRLFSNIESVKNVEQRFLEDLEKHFWSDLKLTKVCDVIAKYAKQDFSVYILYIQNQVYQDRVLTKLQRNHELFAENLCRLESSSACNKLPLLSFLLLPMQRVTRLPLLVSAIVNAADAAGEPKMLKIAKHTLGVVNKLVKKCNEGAKKMQQTEQLAEIASQLDYSSSVKMFALVSQSRSLVKKGEMNVSMSVDSKKSTKLNKLWLFLFTDVMFIARKKSYMESGSSSRFEVVDWAKRSLLYVNEQAVTENLIYLILLENQAGKRVEMTLNPVSQNELSRWTDALSPPSLNTTGESIYETWDCPQFQCVLPYIAEQPDELTIDVGDVMQVLKKTSDGWLEGERLRDGETGWFPRQNCDEIEDEHTRARNMKNLYRTFAG